MKSSFGLAVAVALFAGPAAAVDWKVETLIPGSAFHGVHGIRLGPKGELYAGSVAGQSLWAVDPKSGKARVVIPPPEGMADDIGFGAGGQMVWTAISAGIVYSKRGDGPVEVLARIPSINSIAFSPDGTRLFAAQVFGGDDLWELDPAGEAAPRKIREKMGGFNSFAVGADGKLYGPLWFRGQVVRVDPDTGEVAVLAEGLKTPAAVKLDARGNIYALDTATGELLGIDGRTGVKRLVAQLSPSLDNFEIDERGHAFVTNMADNGIQDVDLATGRVRQVVKGQLCYPLDIALAVEDGRETLYVADSFAFRKVDVATRKVSDIARAYALNGRLQNPGGVAVGKGHVLLTGGGAVSAWSRATGKFVVAHANLPGASDPLELPDGSLLAAERLRGRITRISGSTRSVVAEGLQQPSSLASAPNGAAYVSEMAAGRIVRLDPATGAWTTIVEGLDQPKAIAVGPDGKLYALEAGARQVTQFDPATGAKAVIARNLPVGWIKQPNLGAGGIAVGPSGTVYVSSDVDNSILKITAR